MALLDVLKERTQRRSATAQVDCGELGLLSVEALPPAELERLGSDRAVLYAACRELQSAGEALRRDGKLFAPDEITAYLSNEEAASGAAAVRDISGVTASRRDSGAGTDTASGAAERTDSPGPRTETREIRLDAVQAETARHIGDGQEKPEPGSTGDAGLSTRTEKREIRLDTVQSVSETTKVRHESVQQAAPADRDISAPLPGNHRGQDSREFFQEVPGPGKTDKQSQGVVDLSGWDPRNLDSLSANGLGAGTMAATGRTAPAAHEAGSELPEGMHETTSEFGRSGTEAVHETTSELSEKMHESTSEFGGPGTGRLHETGSELRKTLHETESESGGPQAEELHETTSGYGGTGTGAVHETTSELPETLHETTSESGRNAPSGVHEIRSEVREAVHEMESELTDRVARSILEGLRRAALVR